MNRIGHIILSCVSLLLLSHGAHAQDVGFQNLSDDDFKKIVKDLSANFMHTSVSGASPLGNIFGFEVGVIGGMTNTKNINHYAQQADPSADADKIPHAEVLGVLTVPLALTFEAGLIPKVGGDDFKFSSYSLAAKWSPSELFFDLPLSVAIKAQFTKSTLDAKDTINNIETTYDYDSSMFGMGLIVSKQFAILEPYAGFGFMNTKGDMDVNIPNNVFTGNRTSASAKATSTTFMVGTEVKLLLVKLGVEYANAFGTDRFTGKLSFFF